MLTIAGDVDDAGLARDGSMLPGRVWPAPALLPPIPALPAYRRPGARRTLAPLRDEALFALMCPDSRGPSAIIDAQTFTIHHANRDGLTLLLRNSPFRADGGVLEATSPAAGERLRQALRATRSGASRLVVVDSEYGAVAVRVSPVRPEPGRVPNLALADFSSERPGLSRDELSALAAGFGLTDAEAAVAGLMVDGLSLEAIAVVRGVRRETVRNQCKTILAKMHCHRQVDLVRMALSLCARTAPPA